jgi:hypothetical protein
MAILWFLNAMIHLLVIVLLIFHLRRDVFVVPKIDAVQIMENDREKNLEQQQNENPENNE